MIEFFSIERDGEGRAVIRPPGGSPPSEKQAFEKRCYLNGVTEREVVDELWRARCAQREADRKTESRREGGRR